MEQTTENTLPERENEIKERYLEPKLDNDEEDCKRSDTDGDEFR